MYAACTSNDREVIFESGEPVTGTYGRTYALALNVVDSPTAAISGLARSGDDLFVAGRFLTRSLCWA